MLPLIDMTIRATLTRALEWKAEKAMTRRMARAIVPQMVAFAALTVSCTSGTPQLHTSEAQAVVAFKERVVEYVALHEKLEATLPEIPDTATPQQVDANQRALGELIKSARRDAKPGDFFTPGFQGMVKRVLSDVLGGPGGKTIKASIMDENPGVPQILVNERYPSSVPLSTMPPQLLAPLPKLKGELEFRFLGPRLVLVDTEADIILDFTDEILPR
jgi:hypothetical protein